MFSTFLISNWGERLLTYQGANALGQLGAPICRKHPSGSPVGFLNLSRLLSGFNSGRFLITSHHPYGCYPELQPHLLTEPSSRIQHNPASSHMNMTHLTSSFIKSIVAQHANWVTFMDNMADFLAGWRSTLVGIAYIIFNALSSWKFPLSACGRLLDLENCKRLPNNLENSQSYENAYFNHIFGKYWWVIYPPQKNSMYISACLLPRTLNLYDINFFKKSN